MSIAQNPDGFTIDTDGFAVPACELLADWFAEHPDDPDEGDPAEWPEWTDEITVSHGPAYHTSEALPDPPAPDQGEDFEESPPRDQDDDLVPIPDLPITPPLQGDDTAELDVPDDDPDDSAEFDPNNPDVADYLDWVERRQYERGCNATFAPDCRFG